MKNHIKELRGEELCERRSPQLQSTHSLHFSRRKPALILNLFDYGDIILGISTMILQYQNYRSFRVNKAAKVLLRHPPRSSSTEAKNLDLKPLSTRTGFFIGGIAIRKCLIRETEFNFNFLKNHCVYLYNTSSRLLVYNLHIFSIRPKTFLFFRATFEKLSIQKLLIAF